MPRGVLAIFASWLTAAVFWGLAMMGLFALAAVMDPAHFEFPPNPNAAPPKASWLALTLMVDAIMGLVAGWCIVWFAGLERGWAAWTLLALMVLGLLGTAYGERGLLPQWVSLGRVFVVPVAFVLGLTLRRRSQGKPSELEGLLALQPGSV